MTEEERTFVRHMINQTIERLQKASMGNNHMGSRYAKLLQLLWRKPPKSKHPSRQNAQNQSIDMRLDPSSTTSLGNPTQNPTQQFDPNAFPLIGQLQGNGGGGGGTGFSWLDLGATWNFATQNGVGDHSSSGSTGEVGDGEMGAMGELSPFDLGLLADYSMIEGEGGGLIF